MYFNIRNPVYRYMLIAPSIEVDAAVCDGRPCIAGTRLEISIILEYLEYGKSLANLLESYPYLSEANLRDIVRYARKVIEAEEVIPFEMAP